MIPKIVEMNVIPVAGYDSMLLNLSGAHGPYFTRNVVILKQTMELSEWEKFQVGKK